MFLHLALHALMILAFFYCMFDFCREIVRCENGSSITNIKIKVLV